MPSPINAAIANVLAVPPEPEPPFGAEGSLHVFRAAKNYLRYKLLSWAVRQAGFVFSVALLFVFSRGDLPDMLERFRPLSQVTQAFSEQSQWFSMVDTVVLLFFLIQLPFSWLLVVLDYEYRWYMITDRSLRIREGIWNVREQTMTFSNIQNVEIRRGPIQRLFAIADLEVRTAGGGSAGKPTGQNGTDAANLHVGYFRGVANAPEIRELVMQRLRKIGGTGLGDPDDKPAELDLMSATTALIAEAKQLRASVSNLPTSS